MALTLRFLAPKGLSCDLGGSLCAFCEAHTIFPFHRQGNGLRASCPGSHMMIKSRQKSSDFIYFLFFKDFIYLFMRDTERGRDTGRGRSRLHAGSPTGDSILGPRGHALDQRQTLIR